MSESDPLVEQWLGIVAAAQGGATEPAERARQFLTIPLGPCYGGAPLPPASSVAAFLRQALPDVDVEVVRHESSALAKAYVATQAEPMASIGGLLGEVAQLLGGEPA